MSITFPELIEELYFVDEVTLLEVLNLTSEDIVNAFQDKIEENQEDLQELVIDNKQGLGIYDTENNT